MAEGNSRVDTLIVKAQELVDSINNCGGFCDCAGHDDLVVAEVEMALKALEDG